MVTLLYVEFRLEGLRELFMMNCICVFIDEKYLRHEFSIVGQ